MFGLRKLLSDQMSFFKAVPALVWQLLFFYVPVLFVATLSFVNFIDFSFTFSHYQSLFDWIYVAVILRSLVLAFGTVFFCLLIGYPIAYYLAIRQHKYRSLLSFLLIIPFWTNLLVLAYAWFFILDRDGLLNWVLMKIGLIAEPLSLLNTTIATFIVMVYCYLPFMIMPLYSVLEKFDATLIEASKDLGASQWQTFFKIIFPLSYPGIATGFLVVFVPAFGEFAIPYLVGGDKKMYVGSLITNLFLAADQSAQGAAFTVVSGAVLLSLVGAVYFSLISRLKT